MRFYEPKPNSYRVHKFFAWRPVTLNRETRWLETVYVKENYVEIRSFDFGVSAYWSKISFVDKDYVIDHKVNKYIYRDIVNEFDVFRRSVDDISEIFLCINRNVLDVLADGENAVNRYKPTILVCGVLVPVVVDNKLSNTTFRFITNE